MKNFPEKEILWKYDRSYFMVQHLPPDMILMNHGRSPGPPLDPPLFTNEKLYVLNTKKHIAR